jgi:hypothetical protein
MARQYIKDADGNDVKNSRGERQFYSEWDGDTKPDTKQTTYSESNSIWGGSTKNDATYNRTTGNFNDDSSGSSGSGSDSGGGGGCFLTTACVTAAGLPDDCLELTTLRGLRSRLLATETGRLLIEDYNRRAPQIVHAVEASGAAAEVWRATYADVRRIVALVREERLADAVDAYRAMTNNLWAQFVTA